MAAAITTTTQLTKPVNVIFQQTLLRNAKARCPYFAGSMPGEITENRGTFTATWRRIENLTPTTTALTELTGNISHPVRDSLQPSVTNVSATVSKYGQYILLNEESDLANFTPQMDKLIEVLGISAGRSLNMLQRNELEDNATIVRAGGVASDGLVNSAITANSIKAVVNTLVKNSAISFTPMSNGSQNINTTPILNSYLGLCHPDVAIDVAGLSGFVSVERYAGQVETYPGEFGILSSAGQAVRFIQSEDASVDAGAGASTGSAGLRKTGSTNDLYSTVIFGMDAHGSLGLDTKHVKEVYQAGDKLPAIQLIKKDFGSSGIVDPFNELATLGWKSWHAPKILNSAWIRTLRSGATLVQ